VSLLGRLRNKLPKKTKEVGLKNVIVKSQITYCSTLWSMAEKAVIERVQILLNTRTILKAQYDTPIVEMLASLDFLWFEEQMALDLMTFIFKMDKNLVPKYLKPGSREEVHRYNTRNCSQMNRSSNTGGKWVLSNGVPQCYRLPMNIRNAKSIEAFRKLLRNKIVEERALKGCVDYLPFSST